ncbi:glycosyltransferase family 8 protein [Actinophytocola algeriensis]|uniref:Lipopolysaccharide biosynthesis glycosyltransferase n=1 Tax=Actinophytocola algeriensis TaxID=1768010 RepID=A0A7W7Q343_9PSEU|nr:glycosyltransferase family 8 protein [Actinophytocola algeriensis]MBB4906182.1 lipopolysaccharide biosynthesis glycosyltransferase [Actinophytocola algeriensis]MBE1472133.1 lipopolysaccharide biosynthesis glycosyltransferase [Actinophytocola algeriensis]
MTERLRVVYTVDDNYAMALAVSLHSLAAHTSDLEHITVTIVTPRFADEVLGRVLESCPGLHVEVIRTARSLLDGLPDLEHWSVTPYLKLLIPSLIEDDEPYVVLDADTIVRTDLWELRRTPLDGKAVGAVQDPIMRRFDVKPEARRWVEMGVARSTPYFNAGVMLVDPAECRRLGVMSEALAYCRKYREEIENPDEEAVNVILKGDWLRLEPEWNILTMVVGTIEMAARLGLAYTLPERYAAAVRAPKVVHFSSADKPWHVDGRRGPMSDLFYEHLDRTAWARWRPGERG